MTTPVLSSASGKPPFREMQAVWLVAAAVGLTLVVSLQAMQGKWLIALVAGLFFCGVTVLTGRAERFLLGVLFFAIPFNADFQLFPEVTEWHGTALPSGTPQMGLSAIDLVLGLMVVLWISRLLAGKRRTVLRPAGVLFAAGLIGWAILSLWNAPSQKLGGFLLFNYLKAFLLFFYVANNVRTREDFLLIAKCLIAGMVFESLFVFAQHANGGNLGLEALGERKVEKEVEMASGTLFRPGGTLGHPNELGGYLAAVLPLSLALCLAPFSRKQGSFWRVAAMGTGCAALVLSLSRSAWLAVALVSVVLLFWTAARLKGRFNWGPILGLSTLGLIAAVLFAPMVIARWEEDDRGSTYSRIPQAEMAMGMIRKHPFLGVGLNNYGVASYLYETYVVDPKTRGRVYEHWGRIHNVFLQMASEIGLVGLGWFLLFIASVVRYGWRRIRRCSDDQVRWILMGVLCGLLARLLHDATHTGDFSLIPQVWVYAGLLAAGAWMTGEKVR